jgi:hypothetical protein
MELAEIRRIAQKSDALCEAMINNLTDQETARQLREGLASIVALKEQVGADVPAHIRGCLNQAGIYAASLRESLDPAQRAINPMGSSRRIIQHAEDLRRALADVIKFRG